MCPFFHAPLFHVPFASSVRVIPWSASSLFGCIAFFCAAAFLVGDAGARGDRQRASCVGAPSRRCGRRLLRRARACGTASWISSRIARTASPRRSIPAVLLCRAERPFHPPRPLLEGSYSPRRYPPRLYPVSLDPVSRRSRSAVRRSQPAVTVAAGLRRIIASHSRRRSTGPSVACWAAARVSRRTGRRVPGHPGSTKLAMATAALASPGPPASAGEAPAPPLLTQGR